MICEQDLAGGFKQADIAICRYGVSSPVVVYAVGQQCPAVLAKLDIACRDDDTDLLLIAKLVCLEENRRIGLDC